jgi:hypothetical protein
VRKLIFVAFIIVGTLAGLLAAASDDWTTRIVMAAIGAIFGAAIGGAVAFAGRRAATQLPRVEPIPGMGTSSADLAANYWRDKGHPPFMKPPAVPDKQMFDPDRLS